MINALDFSPVKVTDPPRQGDLIRWYNDLSCASDMWGIIITADCDIAQQKFGNTYTYLPIITASEYIQQYWAKEQLSKVLQDSLSEAISSIYDIHRRFDDDVAKISEDDLIDWLYSSSNGEIFDVLNCVDERSTGRLEKLFNAIRQCLINKNDIDNTYFSALKAIWGMRGKKTQDQLRVISNVLLNLRSEFFLLNNIPQASNSGFIILLREVRSMLVSEYYIDSLELKFTKRTPPYALRVGRLVDRIRFAVLQQFSALFSRIGMETSYEKNTREIVSRVCDSLFNVPDA